MKRALTFVLVVAAGAVPTTASAATSLTRAALPSTYLASYSKAKACSDLITPPWVSWLSYASARVGDEWRVYASSKSLCKTARATADNVISEAPHDDGAGQNLSNMLAWGHRAAPQTLAGLKPAGKSWKCERLPSFWGRQAADLAESAHQGLTEQAFAAASGVAAGAGFCETKAKLTSKKQYKGGSFFAWAPNTSTCQRAYRLKEVPDPAFPGETKPISGFPAALWSDYDRQAC